MVLKIMTAIKNPWAVGFVIVMSMWGVRSVETRGQTFGPLDRQSRGESLANAWSCRISDG